MKIVKTLINVNEQISATMMEKHFQASSLEAAVTAAPNNMMIEILQAINFDLLVYYAQEVDNEALISFFKSTGDIRKILFVKKQNLALVSAELEEILDECFTLPLDSNDFMMRLRRMFSAVEQKKAETSPSFQSEPTGTQAEEEPITAPPIVPAQPVYSYTPESLRQETAEQTDFMAESTVAHPAEAVGSPHTQEQETVLGDSALTDLSKDLPLPTEDADKKSLIVRFASRLSKTLFYLLIFLVALLAVFMVKSKISGGTPSAFGYQLYGVLSGSMNGDQKTSFNTGSLVFVKSKDVNKIEVDDIITLIPRSGFAQ